jgi:serine/threonine-protein kinase
MASSPDVLALLEEMLESGRSPEEVCRDCPELLAEVRQRWKAFRHVDGSLAALFPDPETPPRGDANMAVPYSADLPQVPGYRVEALIGRGGMGVVYRAWHLRLNRPVALKMLPAGPCAQPGERERFEREAQAIAGLGHPNIVQVYDVGDVEGQPYFTMELVEGGNLADHIRGVPQPARQAAALVATLAEAVHAAHQSGIVHRDLKPANILLSFHHEPPASAASALAGGSRLNEAIPKVADFGLARRLEGNGGLTLTGAALGTPSYMAPEQARADRAAIGPATDVYSLGAILYELFAGRPPFRAESATATLQQVVADEPVAPSRLNPQVPRDLTTICLKCLSKEPHRRYPSAAALAEDLHRFLRGEPIVARRAGRVERLVRWARRRPAAATLLGIALLVAATLLGGAGWLIEQWLVTARAVRADLREADQLLHQSAFAKAGPVLERARYRLGDAGPFWLYPAVEAAQRDYHFLVRLETIRLNRSTLVRGQQEHDADLRFNKARADRDYAEAFREQGLGEPQGDPETVAAQVRASKWTTHIVAALDDWAAAATDPARQDWPLQVARRADPDPWRDRVRDPAVWRDGKALAELARSAPLAEQPVSLLLALGERLSATGEDGVDFLRRVYEQFPEDFWVTFALAFAVHGAEKSRGNPLPAMPEYRKALEISPQTLQAVAVLNNLGVVLLDYNWLWDNDRDTGPGAITVLHQAVKKNPRFAPALSNLGVALKNRGLWGLADLMYQDALDIDPRLAPTHVNFGEIRAGSGNLNEAIDHYREALRSDPDCARAHHLLGVALVAKGRRDEVDEDYPESVRALNRFRGPALGEAMAGYNQALGCDPVWTPARNPLRIPPPDEARLQEALDHYRQAVRLDPNLGPYHGALGQALLARREFTEAEIETRRSLDLVPEGDKELRANLESQLLRCQYLRALEGRLPAVVQGTDKPAIGDCLDLAQLCLVKHYYATAAGLYASALAGTPSLADDLRTGHRFNAARAAAQAGCGHGDDAAGLGEPELAKLRKQARDWLRLDLDAWAKKIDTGKPEDTAADRIQARKALAVWRDDPDLAGLRDAAALEKLPAAERQQCQALWQAVADLLRRAETTK